MKRFIFLALMAFTSFSHLKAADVQYQRRLTLQGLQLTRNYNFLAASDRFNQARYDAQSLPQNFQKNNLLQNYSRILNSLGDQFSYPNDKVQDVERYAYDVLQILDNFDTGFPHFPIVFVSNYLQARNVFDRAINNIEAGNFQGASNFLGSISNFLNQQQFNTYARNANYAIGEIRDRLSGQFVNYYQVLNFAKSKEQYIKFQLQQASQSGSPGPFPPAPIPPGPVPPIPGLKIQTIVASGSGGTTENDKSAACGRAENRAYAEAVRLCSQKGGAAINVNYIETFWGKKTNKEKICRVDAHLKCRL